MNKSLLKNNPIFCKIWLANLLSNFGVIFYEIAVIWYVVTTTDSALAAGGISLAILLGGVCGSVLIGQKVDAYPTRKILIILASLRLLILLIFIFIIKFNMSNMIIFYLVAFIFAGINASYSITRAKSVPEIVAQEKITEANALENVSASIVRITSWGLGGVAITQFSLPIALVIVIIGLLISLTFLFSTTWESKIAEKSALAASLGITEGLQIVKKYATVKRIMIAETLYYLLMGFLWVAFPIRVAEIGDGLLYGFHGVAFGIGYLITSLILSSKTKENNKQIKAGRLYLIGFAVYALGNFFLTFTLQPLFFLMGLFISGLGTTFWSTFQMTIFHTTVPTQEIGKIFSVFESVTTMIQVPGFLLGGLLVDTLGTGAVMGLVTILQIIPIALVIAKKSLLNYESSNQG